MAPVIISKAAGLNTQPNELDTQPGSLAVAENVEINRDGVVEVARGFEDFSTNLPDFTPAQLMSVGGTAYLHLDNGIWYYDTTSASWVRKKIAYGYGSSSIQGLVYLSGHLYATSAYHVVYDYNLSTNDRSILAGRYNVSGHTDGTGGSARLNLPSGITTDGTSLYVTEQNNHGVRKITTAGVVTSVAGSATNVPGHADGTGTAAAFNFPAGITWDGSNLYVADSSNNCVRKVTTAGVVTTPYGPAAPTGAANPGHTDSSGNAARFTAPSGITTDGTNLYVADTFTNAIRKVVIGTGATSTLAGPAAPLTTSGHTDGTGSAARFEQPYGIAWDGTNLYVADTVNNSIRKVTTAGVVTTPYGPAAPATTAGTADGSGNSSRFTSPNSICTDGVSFYVSDSTIRKVYTDSSLYVATIDSTYQSNGPTTGIFIGPT